MLDEFLVVFSRKVAKKWLDRHNVNIAIDSIIREKSEWQKSSIQKRYITTIHSSVLAWLSLVHHLQLRTSN